MSDTKVVLLTGGAWWEGSSPANVGHHFVRQIVQNANKRNQPIRLYICTRKPPPTGELERFVRTHHPEHRSDSSRASSDPTPADVELRHVPLDLLDPNSIRNCASTFLAQESKLDVLVLNAAIAPNQSESTGFIVPPLKDAHDNPSEEPLELEKAMMTNVVGTAMLAKLLEPALVDAAKHGEKPRVVLVSSELHRRLGDIEVSPRTIQNLLSPGKWKGMQTYKLTKLIQTIWLFAVKREYGNQIDCVAVSPGFIPSTSLSRASSFSARLFMSYVLHFMPFASTVEEGGSKVYQASLETIPMPEAAEQEVTAVYLKHHKPVKADSRVYNEDLGRQWKRWIDHAVETLTTPVASLVSPAANVLVVGGTAGIGASLARKLAYQLPPTSEITIAGRNSDAAAAVIASIRQSKTSSSSEGTRDQSAIAVFEKVDCARMTDVKRFCEEYTRHLADTGRKLDILILTPGILSMQGRTPAATNSTIDLKMALHYYSRMLFIRELKASLAPQAIVMSVLDGKRSDAHDKAIKWNDLALSEPGNYGLSPAAKHCTAMTDVMMQDFASTPGNGQITTFVHAYPGIVSTGIFANTSLPFYARFILGILSKLFAISPDVCADRLIDGMVKCHRSTLADVGLNGGAGHGGKSYNIGHEKIVNKVLVDSTTVERVRTHTWKLVDEQTSGA